MAIVVKMGCGSIIFHLTIRLGLSASEWEGEEDEDSYYDGTE